MSRLKIATRDNLAAFRPGEQISGAVGWQLDESQKRVELRLFWHTNGKGSIDVQVAETMQFDHPQQEEARPFAFTAPDHPPSFSGQLISLAWALELVTQPGKESARLDLVISPTGREMLLHSHESA